MYFILAIALVKGSGLDLVGSINPSGPMPGYMTVTNQGEIADYYFEFYTDHSVPVNSTLTVGFPSQYQSGLGLASPKCSLGPCTVSFKTVTILLIYGLKAQITYILTIFAIKNPVIHGGTGNFALRTWTGVNLIDSNLIFWSLGISSAPGDLSSATVNVISGGSTYAGDVADYEFRFTLLQPLQAWHWLRFTFPSSFKLAAYPTCSSFAIESNFVPGSLSCSTTGSAVTMTGISQDLTAGKEFGVHITATNPFFSGITGTFTIETGRNSTFTVLNRRANIDGLYISPGIISSISLKPYNPSWKITKKKSMLYRLQFLLKNPIDESGYILLQFTNSFNMDYTTINEIEYGLNDISLTQPATLTYSITTKILKIWNFAAFSPVLISLLLQINTPNSAGPTDPIAISSYLSDSTLVDQDNTQSLVTVTIYSSPASAFIAYPGLTANQATGLPTTIRIHMFPQLEVPQLGYITINIPDAFDIIAAPTCNLKPVNMNLLASPSCTFLDSVLTVQLYADTALNLGKFLATVDSYVEITNIVAPESSGWYIFDFNTYSQVWDFLESGQAAAVLVASDFLSFSADVASGGIGKVTILMIAFQTSKVVPNGVLPFITTDLQGGIEIQLPTMDSLGNLLFLLDLGIGIVAGDSIPCIGISGISGDLVCTVVYTPTIAAFGDNLKVVVSGFNELSIGTNVNIHIAGFMYVSSNSAPTILVTTFKNYNRNRFDLETGSAILVAGSVAPASTATGLNLLLSQTLVNSTSQISHSGSLPLAVATSANPYLLLQITPSHEQGYCKFAAPTCQVNSINYPCTCYPEAELVLVSLTTSLSAPFTITFGSLQNPETVISIHDSCVITLISLYSIVRIFTFANTFPLLSGGTMLDVQVSLSSYSQNSPNTEYIFQLTPQHSMLSGGYLTLIFPPEFSLSFSKPKSKCFASYLPGTPACQIESNIIKLSGYSDSNSLFLLHVTGVRNPNTTVSLPFQCISYSPSSSLIDSHLNIPGVALSTIFKTQNLKYTTLEIFPDNANATADYRFGITPSVYLASQGSIDISFPVSQFTSLPNPPICRLSGYISTFLSCETYKNTIKISLDTTPPYKILYIDIIGLLNPPAGESDSFVIKTLYDNVVLQTNSDSLTAVTSTQAAVLSVKRIWFYPMNEAERATYVFKFIPKADITSDLSIRINFPVEYDFSLGYNITCFSDDLLGNFQCKCFNAYTLTVFGFDSYYACATCSITLYVYGVVNPNYNSSNPYTHEFSIGTAKNGSYVELNEYAGNLMILPAGDYLDIDAILHDRLDSRSTSYMSFNISTSKAIPPTSDQGSIWFTFPLEYPLDSADIHCTSSTYWAQGVPDCKVYIDSIMADAQTEEYYGNLEITLKNLPYPLIEIYAWFITIKIYDGVNFKLLARTYPNLSPNRFVFKYAGPLIVINHDLTFEVAAGTMSSFLPVTLDYPCALNLTLLPYAEGFTFNPSEIQLQTGDVFAEFRVSVPASTANGTYYIYWNTYGEIDPPYYVAVLRTKFVVVKDKVEIEIEQPTPVPIGGTSLPVIIYFKNAPDSDLKINLWLNRADLGLYLSDYELQFSGGEYTKSFTISVLASSNAVDGTVFFSITGSNLDSFKLPFSSVYFNVFSDKDYPEVLSIDLNSISRTSADFTVTSNKISMCYYAFTLRGADVPSFPEVFFQGPAPFYTTKTVYGLTRVIHYRQGTISLTKLNKQTEYTLFVWLQDLTGLISLNVSSLDFKTDTRYKAAELTLYYKQTYLTYEDSALAQSTIALFLSLDNWRVMLNPMKSKTSPNTEVSPSSQSRNLATISSYLSFYILDVDNSEVYPRPLVMISMLSNEKSKLSLILTNFDIDTEIKGVEIYVDSCLFEVYPNVVNVSNNNVTIAAALHDNGKIVAVLLEEDVQPFSFQVYLGLDRSNKPGVSLSADVTAGESSLMIFDKLEANKSYYVFLICTNNYPGHPDLMDDANLVKLAWKTSPQPQLPPLFIDYSMRIVFWIGLFII